MRSALSAGARRSVAAVPTLVRSRSGRLTVALTATLAALVLATLAARAGDAGVGIGAAGDPPAGPPSLVEPSVGRSPFAAGVRYRIAGCRSRGESVYRSGPASRRVAFGFDDGPAADTPAFVRMLARNHAPATFFMIGREITAGYRSTLLHELREGDVLGDHTFTHPNLTQVGDVRAELARTIAVIRGLSGYTPCVFRPPYGAANPSVVATARSLGLATVTWDVDPSDYLQPGTATIEQRVLAEVRPGSIVISHDGGGPRGQTLAAYPLIISALRARGYRIVTIPQLLRFAPVYVRCVRLCDGLGVPRERLPRGAIIAHA